MKGKVVLGGRSVRVVLPVVEAFACSIYAYSIARRKFKKGVTNEAAKGALATACKMLNEVAGATQGVPYIQAISSIISHIVEIDEVRALLCLVYHHLGRVRSKIAVIRGAPCRK